MKRVQEIAEKKGWKMSHVGLAWINRRVASPIIGFSSVERIDEALDMRGKTLTEEEEKVRSSGPQIVVRYLTLIWLSDST